MVEGAAGKSWVAPRVNLLCLVGAVLAMFCFVLPWVNRVVSSRETSSPFDILYEFSWSPVEGGIIVVAAVFFSGMLISLMSQIGGYLQLAGWALFPFALVDFNVDVVGLVLENLGRGFLLVPLAAGMSLVGQFVYIDLSRPFRVRRYPKGTPMVTRLNVFRSIPIISILKVDVPRLVGAVVSVTSIWLTWEFVTWARWDWEEQNGLNLAFVWDYPNDFLNDSFLVFIGAYLFIAGSLLALQTSRAAWVQLAGSLVFLAGVLFGEPDQFGRFGTTLVSLGFGYFLGLAGCLLVFSSLLLSARASSGSGSRFAWRKILPWSVG